MLIDGTRARFGEYEFFFQTFNSNNEVGEVRSVRAVSGIAPATYSLKNIILPQICLVPMHKSQQRGQSPI